MTLSVRRTSSPALTALTALSLAIVGMLADANARFVSAVALQEDRSNPAVSEVLIQASIDEPPAAPVVLRLVRTTIQPDSNVPLHSHPGPLIGRVEAGVLTIPAEGEVTAMHAQREGTPAPTDGVLTLNPGDQFVVPAGTNFAYRNENVGPVTFVSALLLPLGENVPPSVTWPEGTPALEELTGVQSRSLGTGALPSLPAGPLQIILDRLALAPGVAIPARPWPLLLSVEVGTFAFALVEGNVQVTLAREPNELRVIDTPGAQVVLGTGDAVVFPLGMAEIARADEQGILVLLRLSIVGTEQASPEPTTPTPTQEPEPEPEPEQETPATTPTPSAPGIEPGMIVTVTENGVRLRDAPSLTGNLLIELRQGQELEVTGDAVEADGFVWWPVTDPETGTSGYVAEEFLAPQQ